jgi:hypothetical protein
MDNQKLIKELSTWNQQMSTLRKVKKVPGVNFIL